MTRIEEVVAVLHLHNGACARPAILASTAIALQNGLVIFSVGDEILGGRQIDGVVEGVAALLQVVDIVHAVLVIGHGIAHIRLADAIHRRQEE